MMATVHPEIEFIGVSGGEFNASVLAQTSFAIWLNRQRGYFPQGVRR